MRKIHIVRDCAPGLASAISAFEVEWGPYSAASKRFSIYRLVELHIDEAWFNYVNALPQGALFRELWGDQPVSKIARAKGFKGVDELLAKLFNWSSLLASPQPSAVGSVGESLNSFRDTLETMREFSKACAAKRPKRQALGPLNGMRRSRELCELCGNRTELQRYRDGEPWPQDGEESLRLSSRYCSGHRPRFLDDSWNPAYRRATLSRQQFNEETLRLTRQSAALASPKAQSGDATVDLFYLKLTRKCCFYADEESAIRNEARALVDAGMTDRKKRFVVQLAQGLPQAEIARQAGLDRQAVWRDIRSVPVAYRFDLDW